MWRKWLPILRSSLRFNYSTAKILEWKLNFLREENRSNRRKNLGVRLRSTNLSPRVEPRTPSPRGHRGGRRDWWPLCRPDSTNWSSMQEKEWSIKRKGYTKRTNKAQIIIIMQRLHRLWTCNEKRAGQHLSHSSPLDTRREMEEKATQEHMASSCGKGTQDPSSHIEKRSEAGSEQTKVAYLCCCPTCQMA